MTTREQVAETARAWLRTRWHHQASLRGVGSDCAGLVTGVARESAIPNAVAMSYDLSTLAYGRQPDPGQFLALCEKHLDRIEVRDVKPADIIAMRIKNDPQHLGILVPAENAPTRLVLIHALATARKVVEHEYDEYWRLRTVRAYSFRGVL